MKHFIIDSTIASFYRHFHWHFFRQILILRQKKAMNALSLVALMHSANEH